jgi:hypothetical protein
VALEDVERYVARRFAIADRSHALSLLEAPVIHDGTLASPRLIRSAAIASGGSLPRLKLYIEMLKHDWRDVIVAGEYEPDARPKVRLRDLSQPIGDDV